MEVTESKIKQFIRSFFRSNKDCAVSMKYLCDRYKTNNVTMRSILRELWQDRYVLKYRLNARVSYVWIRNPSQSKTPDREDDDSSMQEEDMEEEDDFCMEMF